MSVKRKKIKPVRGKRKKVKKNKPVKKVKRVSKSKSKKSDVKKAPGKSNVAISSLQDLKKALNIFKKLKQQKAELENAVSIIQHSITEIELKIFQAMSVLDTPKIATPDFTFFQTSRQFYSYNPDDPNAKDKASKWVKDKHPELLSFNMHTMNSFLNALVLEKKSNKCVPNFFKMTPIEKVGMRKATPKIK